MFFGPSSLFARLSAILKRGIQPGRADLHWYALVDQNHFGNLIRNGDHLTNNGTFAHVSAYALMFAALGVFFDSSARKQNHRRYRVAPGVPAIPQGYQIDRTTAFLQTRHFSKDMTGGRV